MDESSPRNGQELLLALAYSISIKIDLSNMKMWQFLSMTVWANFKGEDIENKIKAEVIYLGSGPQYVISDNAHNLKRGIISYGNVIYKGV